MGKKMTPERRQFAERLRHTREATGLSVKDVSRITGVGENAIHNYEAGTRMPNFIGPESDGVWLCKVFAVETNWLTHGDPSHLDHRIILRFQAYGWDVLEGGAPPPLASRRARLTKKDS